jgi:hypothetical protein
MVLFYENCAGNAAVYSLLTASYRIFSTKMHGANARVAAFAAMMGRGAIPTPQTTPKEKKRNMGNDISRALALPHPKELRDKNERVVQAAAIEPIHSSVTREGKFVTIMI